MHNTQSASLPPPAAGTSAPSAANDAAAVAAGEHSDAAIAFDPTLGRPRWIRWLARIATAVSLVGLLVIVVAAVVPSRWFVEAPNARLGVDQPAPYAEVPAAASSVDEIISFGDLGDEAEVYRPSGDFYYVTVTFPTQTALSWWASEDDPTVRFLTYEDVYGYATPDERQAVSRQMMTTSEQRAQYVALERLGFPVTIEPGPVVVDRLICLEGDASGQKCNRWAPADEFLDPGDTVIAADGVEIGDVDDLVDVLKRFAPGDRVEITVLRGEKELTGEVELISSGGESERALIGFERFDTTSVVLPFDLKFNTGRTGGPSAGLAFTLALTDELSPGELTGDRRIAVTGTINTDGEVGPIGGLVQKASAVEQAGIEVFLVPAAQGEENIAEAQAAVGDDLEIIPVATFDEALEVLEDLGGDPLPEPVAKTAPEPAG